MTIKELSQLYYLKREIAGLEMKISELEAKAVDTSVKITGMPHSFGVSDKVGRLIAEIDCYRHRLEERRQCCTAELLRLNDYIAECDDSLTRQILTYRFIDGLSWGRVAVKVGGGNTSDSCRMNVKRFLKKL